MTSISEPMAESDGGSSASVGIIFYFSGHLWIDATPVETAVPYGNLATHDRGHDGFWQHLQDEGLVPPGIEYDDVPRGRVSYNTKTDVFLLFLDTCILRQPELVKAIIRRLNLPPETPASRDPHYRCPGCMRGRSPMDDPS